MTKDFRNVGRLPAQTPPAAPGARPAGLAPHHRIVLLALYLGAAGFFLAGLWLLGGRPSPLPAETAPLLGLALVVSAVADLVAAAMLKRFWARQAAR